MRPFVFALIILFPTTSAFAQQSKVIDWSTSGRDLYQKCASADYATHHACAEYMLGILDGVVAALPANAQLFCPPKSLSFFQLENAYIVWAKANNDLLGRDRMSAATAALVSAFPCGKH